MLPTELAGLTEIASLLKVARSTAQTYTQRPDFPEPVDRLASGPVWRITDVERWAQKTLPLPRGRPRRK